MGKPDIKSMREFVEALPAEELVLLEEMIAEIKADRWEREIERDSLAGKLDRFADRARTEHRAGRTRPL
jgi:hypothetical protein